jgi:hypothetical protein
LEWWMDLLTPLYTQLGSTSNYSGIADFHTLQITTVPAKSFPSCCVFIRLSLVTASNSGDSLASRSQVLYLHILNSELTTNWVAPIVLLTRITTVQGSSRKHHFQKELSCCVRIRWSGNLFTDLLPRNGVYNTLYYWIPGARPVIPRQQRTVENVMWRRDVFMSKHSDQHHVILLEFGEWYEERKTWTPEILIFSFCFIY